MKSFNSISVNQQAFKHQSDVLKPCLTST